MYKKQTSSIARQSQKWIADALINLWGKYTFHEITITQICQESQLVRKTFYRNFENKEDILHYILDNIFASFQENYDVREEETFDILSRYYEYLSEYRTIFKYLYRDNMFYLVAQKYVEYTKSIGMFNLITKEEWKQESTLALYAYQFIANGMLGILELWIARDFKDTIADLAKLTDALLLSANRYISEM